MISRHPLLTIFVAGFFSLFCGLGGGYYWASLTPGDKKQEKNSKLKQVENSNQVSQQNRDGDTVQLSADNWESFLKYEGKRIPLLGIKKKYRNVNFRRGAATSYDIIATPSGGTLLIPLDRFNGWYRARLRNGRIGWIHKSLVRTINTPEPIVRKFRKNISPLKRAVRAQIPTEFLNHNRVRVVEDKVNLRQGAGRQFSIINRAYKHQIFRLLSKQGKWLRVKTHRDQLVWVYRPLVEIIYLKPKSKRKTIQLKKGKLRPEPRYQFRQSKEISKETKAEVLEKDGKWYQVKTRKGKIGWITEEELKKSG